MTIVLATDSPGPTDFAFSGDLGSFALDDDGDATLGHFRLVNNLLPGTLVVSELLPIGWNLASIVCNDPDAGTSVDVGAGQASIDLDFGEAITCTFGNTLDPAFIFADGFESGDTSAWSSTLP